jgi:hypothetical protein
MRTESLIRRLAKKASAGIEKFYATSKMPQDVSDRIDDNQQKQDSF